MELTPELLAGAVAIILSLLFSYIPGLNAWFAGLKDEYKRLIMLGLLLLVAGLAYGLACWGMLVDLTGIGLTCDRAGLLGLIRILVVAIIANQAVYSISPRAPAVQEAKAARLG